MEPLQLNKSLSLSNQGIEQLTAVLDGKRVLGLPREIQEVRNAFATYEAMTRWRAESRADR